MEHEYESEREPRSILQVPQVRANTFFENPRRNVYAWETTALDAVDATALRSVAYTAMPYANMHWDPHVVVVDDTGHSVVLHEP